VTGPPGSGKTTLVASYLAERKLPGLWYRLDAGDSDPSTFFYYLGLATKRAAPRTRKPLPLLTPEYLLGLTTFSRRYFEALYDRLPRQSAVVFDNYHDVSAGSPFHEVISAGLEVIPDGRTVVVIGRDAPPPALARLGATESMMVIGWEDLRLTENETESIARRHRPGLPLEHTRSLHGATNGWAAGVTLMLKHPKTEGQPEGDQRHRSHDAVFDYFAGEIFAKMDRRVQDFLLHTAFLPQMSAHMAERVTGEREAGTMLADLNRRQCFTELYDASKPVYRYHDLFRDFLLARAASILTPVQISQAWHRAATALEASGQVEEAVALFRKADDWAATARLILKHAGSLIAQGRNRTLEDWLIALPEGLMKERPWLEYWLGVCRMPVDPVKSRGHFEKAFERFQTQQDQTGVFLAWSGAVDTFVFLWDEFKGLDPWIEWMDAHRPDARTVLSPEIAARVTVSMAAALLYRQPDHPEMEAWIERAVALSAGISDLNLRLQIFLCAANYYSWGGDWMRFGEMVERLRAVGELRRASTSMIIFSNLWMAVYQWIVMADHSWVATVSTGLEESRSSGVALWDALLSAQGCYGALTDGDPALAAEYLSRMAAATNPARRLDVSHYHYLASWHAICVKNLPQAAEHIERATRLAEEVGAPFPEALCRLAMAQVLHEQGHHQQARKQLTRARRLGGRLKKGRLLEYTALVTEAQFAFQNAEDGGSHSHGVETLRRAMAMGRERGYINFSWWRPSVMADLCLKALEAGIEVEYVQSLIKKRNLALDPPSIECASWPWLLKIFTLGRFSVVKEGTAIGFTGKPQRKPIELLKVILAFGGKGVGEHKVIEVLWPDAEGDLAKHAFESALSRLRKLLGCDGAIALVDGCLTVDPRTCWVDLWAFERLAARVEEMLRGEGSGKSGMRRGKESAGPDPIEPLAQQALALYQGRFLDEVQAAWALSRQERLHRKSVDLVGRMGDFYEQNRRWEKAIDWYHRGLEIDGIAEKFYQRLMVCQGRLGRRAEATNVYRRCRQTLRAIVGVEPSRATEAIFKSALSS
jgi:two-component SAPR family response regulator